jgi:hypothetical protein
MAAPIRPVRTAVPWAPGNYTTGPYTGSPARVAPATPVLVPGTGAAAETVNYALGTASDDVAELQTWAKATQDARAEVACANWKLPTVTGTNNDITTLTYNAAAGLWLACSGSSIYSSPDGGETWANGSLSIGILAAAVGTNPVSGNSIFLGDTGSRPIATYIASTATWSLGAAFPAVYADSDICFLAGGRAAWTNLSGTSRTFSYSDNDGTSFTAGTGTYMGTGAMKIASSGALLVGACAAPTTTRQYVTSSDGASWTTRTFPTTAGSATGVTWDPYRSVFVAALSAASGAGSTILSSSDGITWTTVSSQASYKVSDILASPEGSLLALGAVAGLIKVLYSLDGGVTWLQVETTCPVYVAAATTASPRGPTIKHGAGRWAIVNSSLAVRMSLTYAGFTPTALTF